MAELAQGRLAALVRDERRSHMESDPSVGGRGSETRHVAQHERRDADFGPLRLTQDVVTR
jgi:hypothetical protein